MSSILKKFTIITAIFSFLSLTAVWAQSSVKQVEIINNQPFPVRMPVRLSKLGLAGKEWQTSKDQPVQADGDGIFVISDVPASSTASFNLQSGKAISAAKKLISVNANDSGISLEFAGTNLGNLTWQILYRNSKPEELKGEPYSTKADFSTDFKPLAMKFEKVAEGAVFDSWRGVGEASGLQLTVELRVFHDGFLDINSSLKNVNAAKTTNVYAAVVTRWQQPNQTARSVDYDNRLRQLGTNDWTNFREGESRNWYVQRGIDWLRTDFEKHLSVAWMNDFSPSFTVHQEAKGKRVARWVGANIPQVGIEAQSKDKDLYILTEIARSNLKSYAERLEDNRLMDQGESANYSSRLVFNQAKQTDEQTDNAFVAYASYASQKSSGNKIEYSIGVPYTRFGTNYFPYSTLGENFDLKKLPGMDRDSYWAFAADTVTKWQLFADEIRRDLRIAKTLGFELIRLHHLEMIQGIDKKTQFEYLDFLFGEMKKLKLKVLIDARVSAEDTAELVKRYRDMIDGVEVDNEVLIFSINDDAPDYWRRVYKAVKAIAPEIPVHLTAHTNTGAFDRLQKLDVPFDKIGLHAYSDGLDSMPNTRGFSLASASYGRRVGKEPIITEWNWRFLTRLTEDDRAKVYSPIFENVLKTRSMPTMYQFQFNESMAMSPRVLKGIRHYEQVWLSRRPKPEAFVLSGLINKYGAPNHPNKLLNVEHGVVELDKNGKGTAQFKVTNTSNRDLNLKAAIESAANLKANFIDANSANLSLKPTETKTVSVVLEALPTDNSPAPLPGFYHIFLRLEDGDLLRYGWTEARLVGEPKFDKDEKTAVVYGTNALDFSLNRPLVVVYGTDSPIQDVETAYAVVNVLESATGRPVKVCTVKDLSKDEQSALVLVGTAKTNPLIASLTIQNSAKQFVERVNVNSKDWLILSGADPLEAERAAMDWSLRFWKYAKDSAARRVGLVEKELPLGFDPAKLP